MAIWWVTLESSPGTPPCGEPGLERLIGIVGDAGHAALAPTGELYGRLHFHAADSASAGAIVRRKWKRYLSQAGVAVRATASVDIVAEPPVEPGRQELGPAVGG